MDQEAFQPKIIGWFKCDRQNGRTAERRKKKKKKKKEKKKKKKKLLGNKKSIVSSDGISLHSRNRWSLGYATCRQLVRGIRKRV